MKIREYAIVTMDPQDRAVYGCPEPHCDFKSQNSTAFRQHASKEHKVDVAQRIRRDSKGWEPPAPELVGETIVVGPTPNEPTTITIEHGRSRRRIVTYLVSMADTTDLIAGALRQAIERGGKR